jgi:hypothetical protein
VRSFEKINLRMVRTGMNSAFYAILNIDHTEALRLRIIPSRDQTQLGSLYQEQYPD